MVASDIKTKLHALAATITAVDVTSTVSGQYMVSKLAAIADRIMPVQCSSPGLDKYLISATDLHHVHLTSTLEP